MIYHNDLLASVRDLLCVARCDLIGGHLLTVSLPCVCSASTALMYLRPSSTWLEPQPDDIIERFVRLTRKDPALSWHGALLLV